MTDVLARAALRLGRTAIFNGPAIFYWVTIVIGLILAFCAE